MRHIRGIKYFDRRRPPIAHIVTADQPSNLSDSAGIVMQCVQHPKFAQGRRPAGEVLPRPLGYPAWGCSWQQHLRGTLNNLVQAPPGRQPHPWADHPLHRLLSGVVSSTISSNLIAGAIHIPEDEFPARNPQKWPRPDLGRPKRCQIGRGRVYYLRPLE